ncbi:hypothetical protein AGMMS49992_25140 [Clostridia bacterium]|nr:hypothetical protein AGMMS49992_25140 [Clostridia bacterium]
MRRSRILAFYPGSDDYAQEELIAEFGAAYLLHDCGLSTDKTDRNDAAYIQSWSARLRKDPYLFPSAASKARQAVDFFSGHTRESWTTTETDSQKAA